MTSSTTKKKDERLAWFKPPDREKVVIEKNLLNFKNPTELQETFLLT